MEGLKPASINTLRSAISMTHREVDSGSTPHVLSLPQGGVQSETSSTKAHNDMGCGHSFGPSQWPPRQRLPGPATTFPQIDHAVALALTNSDRCSDLAAQDFSYCTYLGNGVKVIIPGLTKTRVSEPPLEALYPAFSENQKLCPAQTL